MPIENSRAAAGGEDWLGAFLREQITTAFMHHARVAVLEAETSRYWRRRLGLRGLSLPSQAQLEGMGVDAIVLGTSQQVLKLTELRMRVWLPRATGSPPTTFSFRFQPEIEGPPQVLSRLSAALKKALRLEAPLKFQPAPNHWAAIREVYGVISRPLPDDSAKARSAKIAQLKKLTAPQELRGRVFQSLARLKLELALLSLPEGPQRRRMLLEAKTFARAAVMADREHTDRLALKGEIHFFLKEDFGAKTEASVARLKNPLNALAHLVLGLTAGISTGAGNQHLKRAFEIAPYLNPAIRGKDDPIFQGGILDPLIFKWQRLKASRGFLTPSDYRNLITEGIAHFENEQWEKAQDKFMAAAKKEQDDFRPLLYLNRILIRKGKHADAAAGLRRLAQENPQQAAIHHFLGVALIKDGEQDGARKAFHRALEEDPKHHESAFQLALIEISNSKWREALTALRKTMRDDPENPRVWVKMGEVREKLKDFAGAKNAFVRALELEAANAEAQQGMKRLQGK